MEVDRWKRSWQGPLQQREWGLQITSLEAVAGQPQEGQGSEWGPYSRKNPETRDRAKIRLDVACRPSSYALLVALTLCAGGWAWCEDHPADGVQEDGIHTVHSLILLFPLSITQHLKTRATKRHLPAQTSLVLLRSS